MNISDFKMKLKTPPKLIEFADTMSVIETNYDFIPTTFKNGDLINESGQNSGSCKLFAFAVDQAGNSSQFLQSPLINVSGAATVDLSFEHRFNTETCCDHGYVVYRFDGGFWQIFTPTIGPYNIFDFMYNLEVIK